MSEIVINIIKPNEHIPSLNKINTFMETIYEIKKDDGNVYRLLESQYRKKEQEKNKQQMIRSKQKVNKHRYSTLGKNNMEYWDFIRYLSKNSRIGGFQAVKNKISQLKMDYFNATGEDLKDDQFNPDLSPKTYGNAMRIYFELPPDFSADELNEILPGDVEAKKWSENSNEYCISRIGFVLELLSMGFRHGTDHKLDEIEYSIKKLCAK